MRGALAALLGGLLSLTTAMAGDRAGAIATAAWDGGALGTQWTRDCGRSIDLPMIEIGADVLVTTSDHRVTCLERATGRERWAERLKQGVSLPPAADRIAGRVWVVEGTRRARLVALDLADGEIRARIELDQLPTAIVADSAGPIVLSRDGEISAYDERSREALWAWRGAGALAPGLRLDGATLYVAARADSVWAISRRDGRRLWGASVEGRRAAAPVLRDGSLVLASVDGTVSLLTPESGDLLRRERREPGALHPPLLWAGALVSFSPDGTVEARSVTDGTPLWTRETGEVLPHPLVGAGPVLLASTAKGRVIAFRGATGETAWSLDLPGRASVEPLVGDDDILVATERGEVFAYAPLR